MRKVLFIAATALLSASLALTANTASACDKDGKKDKKEASCAKASEGKSSCCQKSSAAKTGTTATTASVSTAAVSADAAAATQVNTVSVDVITPATADAPAKAVTVEKK